MGFYVEILADNAREITCPVEHYRAPRILVAVAPEADLVYDDADRNDKQICEHRLHSCETRKR